MPSAHGGRYDFFLSCRGSVAAIAQEVTDVLTEKGYHVCTQDYDMPLGSSFVEGMHDGIKNSRDLIILFTRDYEQSRYTREEFASFAAQRLQDPERHVVIRRCEDAPLEGPCRQGLPGPGWCGRRRGAQASHHRRSRAPSLDRAKRTAIK